MNFCDFCDNLLHLAEIDNNLIHICSTCKRTCELPKNFNPCVMQQNYGGDEKVFYECFINKYTKYDPTLPRVSSIPCPNKDCKSNLPDEKDKIKNEIIYVRYNEEDMRYVYLCCNCDQSWIQPEYEKIVLLNKIEPASKV